MTFELPALAYRTDALRPTFRGRYSRFTARDILSPAPQSSRASAEQECYGDSRVKLVS